MDNPNPKQQDIDVYVKSQKNTIFNKFIDYSKDLELNQCLISKCGGDEGQKCLKEVALTEQILECLSQENFLGKWGMDRSEIDKHRCQMSCEIGHKTKPTDVQFFINKNKKQLKVIDDFLNPYNENQSKFHKINQCVISDKKIWDYYSQIRKNERVFEKTAFDDLINKTLKNCFLNQFQNDYDDKDLVVTQCAFQCQVFDPEIKNKIKYYGNSIVEGKYQNYSPNILLFD